jgi:hypothetical protein
MRADIEPRAHVAAIPMQDQRFRIAVEHDFDFGEATVLDQFDLQQRNLRCVIV